MILNYEIIPFKEVIVMIEEKEKTMDLKSVEALPKEEESREKKRVKNLFAFIIPYILLLQTLHQKILLV